MLARLRHCRVHSAGEESSCRTEGGAVEGWLTVASLGQGQYIQWHLRKEDGDHYHQEKKLTRRMKSVMQVRRNCMDCQ
jgi:hypothetical protein